jgi:hypothetical protein
MKDPEVTIVNTLAVSGFLNGIVNLGFTTAQFLPRQLRPPEGDGMIVDAAEIMTANLRMDLVCAQQVHDALGRILEQNTKSAPAKAN